jgi:hypothetical protein
MVQYRLALDETWWYCPCIPYWAVISQYVGYEEHASSTVVSDDEMDTVAAPEVVNVSVSS